MFEGIYFQFPKLGFLLFFFLACEALCPLRANPIYFPRIGLFSEIGVKPPLWLWIAKWAMITFLIIALMSPVRDRERVHHQEGWDILLIVDPSIIEPKILSQITSFIHNRPQERVALWVPPTTVVPLTYEHEALISILQQTFRHDASISINRKFGSFFSTSPEGKRLALILTDTPKSFVYSLPIGVQTLIISPMQEVNWKDTVQRTYPPYTIHSSYRFYDYYYVYPLFLGFLAMMAYVYGRNQKGIR